MILIDFLVDIVAALVDPFRESHRHYSTVLVIGMVLLVAAGAGAIYYFTR